TWDSGIDARNVTFIRMKPHLSGYDQSQSQAYFHNVQRRLESLAGVESVAFAVYPPLRGWGYDLAVAFPGQPFSNDKNVLRAPQNKVTPGFFETMRIQLLRGRSFTNQDLQEGRRAVIVNEPLAEQLWPKQEAVGRTVIVENQPCEVVGVARYNNFRRSGEPSEAFIFRAEFGGNRLLVHLQSDPRAMLPQLRREILS